MPRLQKLYEKYKERSDVLLLTLNLDSNPALAEAFVRKNHLAIPVLMASTYARVDLHVFAVPDNWIVDAEGIVRLKQIHYSSSQKWEEWMSELIEKNRPAAATSPPSPAP